MHNGTQVLKQIITINAFCKTIYDAKIRPKLSEIGKGELLHGPGTSDFEAAHSESLKVCM